MNKARAAIATATNVAYVLAGVAIYQMGSLWPGLAVAVMGVCSAVHHYWFTALTQKVDYAGMYVGIGGLLAAGFGLSGPIGFIVASAAGALLLTVFGASRTVVAAGILGLFAVVSAAAGLLAGLECATFLAVAFAFNHLGESHASSYSLFHGLGWHIPTAYAAALAAQHIII